MFRSIFGSIVLLSIVGCASPVSRSSDSATTTTPSTDVVANSAGRGTSCTFPNLREELLAMRDVDQDARKGFTAGEYDLQKVVGLHLTDARNTSCMKKIVAEFGWPTKSLVGADGAQAAWLLVQHADRDPAFQRACLELMRLFGADEVSLGDVAYLTDRVLVNEGKLQIYGTQFHEVDGHLEPRPIEDPDSVDARRASVGLGTLAEYRELMGE